MKMYSRPTKPGIASLQFNPAEEMFLKNQQSRIKNLVHTNSLARQQVVAMLTSRLSNRMISCRLNINEEKIANGE